MIENPSSDNFLFVYVMGIWVIADPVWTHFSSPHLFLLRRPYYNYLPHQDMYFVYSFINFDCSICDKTVDRSKYLRGVRKTLS